MPDPSSRRRRLEARLSSLARPIPDLPLADLAELHLRPARELVVRALCHGLAAQLAQGLDLDSTRSELERWGVEPALRAEERALLDGREVDDRSLALGYEQEAAFALLWALGLAEHLPAFNGSAQDHEDTETALTLTLFEQFDSLQAFEAAAEPRPPAEVAAEIDYLAAYAAVYVAERPGWQVGEASPWIGPCSPEAVSARLRALRWAAEPERRR